MTVKQVHVEYEILKCEISDKSVPFQRGGFKDGTSSKMLIQLLIID